MTSRTYERLSIERFGRHLIQSGDLDPIYIALVKANFDEGQLHRWLIAYWCFYHAGVACYMSEFEGSSFWAEMSKAAANEESAPCPAGRWPRGHERRHFRGANATLGVSRLQARYPNAPEEMVQMITAHREIRGGELCVDLPLDFKLLSRRAQEHHAFGPWIGFKIADMTDRVLGIPVKFENAHVFMFKDPEEAALKLWRLKRNLPDSAKPKDKAVTLQAVTDYLIKHFEGLRAPPFEDRPPNIQEIETVLCKWKSHMNGHYPLNNDIDEIGAGLIPWLPKCSTARTFLQRMPNRLEAA